MKIILNSAETEIEVKKSKFICNIKPVKDETEAQNFIRDIKKKHHKATHNVPVYLIGLKHEIQRYSDDGEPTGTAGLPVLRMLMTEGVSNISLVITRYFGGIKLGKGGLVRAYTQSAKTALQAAGISELRKFFLVSFSLDYSYQAKFEHEIKVFEHYIKDVTYSDKVKFEVYVPERQEESLSKILTDLNSGLPEDYTFVLVKGIVSHDDIKEI